MQHLEGSGTAVLYIERTVLKVKRDWKRISKRNTPPVFGEGISQTYTIKTLKQKTGECRELFVGG